MSDVHTPAPPLAQMDGVGPARHIQPCGTSAAYRRHYRRGEPIDEACKAAHQAYNTRWKRTARARWPMSTCASCQEWKPICRYDWCEACVTRWQRAGRPDTGPPPLKDPAEVLKTRQQIAAEGRASQALTAALRKGGWEWVA